MSGHTKESIIAKLKELKIDSRVIDHAPVLTCEKHTEALEAAGASTEGQAKNLFYKAPSNAGKMKNRLFLVTALTDTTVDGKGLSVRLGLKASTPLRFANEKLFDELLQVPLGSVTPFCMANDTAHEIVMLMDQKFKECSQLLFHPMLNDATSVLTPAQLQTFVDATCANRALWIDFSATDPIEVPEVGAAAGEQKVATPKKDTPRKEEAKRTSISAVDPAHDPNQGQLFAEDQYFGLQAWSEGPFAKAHEEWLKTQ